MFDALGVSSCRVFADSQSQQKLQYHFVPLPRRLGKSSACPRESDGCVWLSLDQTVPLQPRNGPIHRDVSDAELAGKVRDPALALLAFDFVNGLDVVLGKFCRVIVPRANVSVSGFPAGGHGRCLGWGVEVSPKFTVAVFGFVALPTLAKKCSVDYTVAHATV